MDGNKNPLVNTPVTVYAIQSTLPGGLSGALVTLENAYGIPAATAQLMLSNVTEYNGTTDGSGYIVVLMISTIKYQVNWTDALGYGYTYLVYPQDSYYQLGSANSTTPSIYAQAVSANTNLANSVYVANMTENANQTVATLRDYFYDASGQSNGLNCWFKAPNGTVFWQNSTFAYGAGLKTCGLAVPANSYDTWQWGAAST